jgi:hypothetical protein
MSERFVPIDQLHLAELIRNPIIIRIVSILDLACLSILELLEYNLERRETNYALSEGIITIDKTGSHATGIVKEQEVNILLNGDSYFYNFLSSKVRLTELGLYILDSIKGVPAKIESPVQHSNQYDLSTLNPPIIQSW